MNTVNPNEPRTPQEKKALSLKKDRRNVYGESPHGSRKAIPRNKRIGQSRVRAAVNPHLQIRGAVPDDDALQELEQRVEAKSRAADSKRFRKSPDAPLGQVIQSKQERRVRDHRAKEKRRQVQQNVRRLLGQGRTEDQK